MNPTWEIRQGDAIDQLRLMDARSIHCVVTSPPYWGLRDYSVAGAYGLEPTLEEYIQRMVEVFREVRRVLRVDGTCWLNLGDSYSSGMRSSYDDDRHKYKKARAHDMRPPMPISLKPKDIVGVPWLVAFALQADGWWLRSDIVWHKPNPMPESVRDRPTRAHEFLFLLAQSGAPKFWTHREAPGSRTKPPPDYRYIHRETGEEVMDPPDGWDEDESPWRRLNLWRGHDYFYDADAVRETSGNGWHSEAFKARAPERHAGENRTVPKEQQAMGANKRDVWTIATQAYAGDHFATFPEKLVETCILAGTPVHGVCAECGAPWAQVVERTGQVNHREPAHVPNNSSTKTDST